VNWCEKQANTRYFLILAQPVVYLLLRWYKTQQLCIHWMGRSSNYFSNGLHQRVVLSPILFNRLLQSLS